MANPDQNSWGGSPTSQPIYNNFHNSSGSKRKIKLLLSILLIAAIAAGGWFYFKPNAKTYNATQPYIYQYGGPLRQRSLTNKGADLVFGRPEPFVLLVGNMVVKYGPEFANLSTADYAHFVSVVHNQDPFFNNFTISSLSIGASAFDKPPTTDYLTNIKTALASAETDNKYQAQTKTLKNFVATGSQSRYKITLAHAQPFTNPNIKDNAWQFDLSFVDQAALAARQYTKRPVYKGEFIYAIGQKGYYYFSLISLDYDWQNNQTFWQRVIDSIKVN